MGKNDPYWICGSCKKWTFNKVSVCACLHCNAPPAGRVASWLAEQAQQARKPAVGSGKSAPTKTWAVSEWLEQPHGGKKGLRRAKSRAAKAAAKEVPVAPAPVIEIEGGDDMDTTDEPAAIEAAATAKEIAALSEDIANLRKTRNMEALVAKLTLQRDGLQSKLDSARSPQSRFQGSKRLLAKATAAKDKAEAGVTDTKRKMSDEVEASKKRLDVLAAIAEKFGKEMREAELEVATHQGTKAIASRELAEAEEKLNKKTPAVVALAVDPRAAILAAVGADDVAGNIMVEKARVFNEQLATLLAELAVHNQNKAASACGPVGVGDSAALGGLQPSPAEAEKELARVSAARSEGTRTPDAREPKGRSAPYG
jgi:hypothetical protein